MFEIRPTKVEDFPKLVELNNLIWNAGNSPQPIKWTSIEQYAKYHPAGSQYVGIVNGELAGYIQAERPSFMSFASSTNTIEIIIGVHPAHQGKKVGTRLIDYISRVAMEEKRNKLLLKVLSTNDSAIAFYKKCGFKEQGRVKHKYFLNGQFVDDIFMIKQLYHP
ncbi:GNAT family N-acetyltransferase [Heyndrickxia acidicola]|uniref:GNAT family N-acetyltransferase n=1 Tax=Heyndrickxia acidicola TaxID=209389 RepID=A0ABU6MI04_9BACI|nr:GNAT family N-acetyltransferase [Heyndrickxia acidicola]MED1204312.1 GNAT family N-acetyltransferase [Heyndrickxia acidicola]